MSYVYTQCVCACVCVCLCMYVQLHMQICCTAYFDTIISVHVCTYVYSPGFSHPFLNGWVSAVHVFAVVFLSLYYIFFFLCLHTFFIILIGFVCVLYCTYAGGFEPVFSDGSSRTTRKFVCRMPHTTCLCCTGHVHG